MYMLEVAEPYVVQSEQLKNRTCYGYRWKQVAKSDNLQALKNIMGDSHRIINWDSLEVICQTLK